MKKVNKPLFRRLVCILMLTSFNLLTFAQKTITGTVTDGALNEPFPGVNVVIQGTTTGTVTDLDGKYTITATPEDVLVFSFIGYSTVSKTVGEQTTIDITMSEDKTELDQVIVVGYGVQKKSDITGSITSVKADKLREVPAASIAKALQGKTAGVEIVNTNRRPGSEPKILIRGSRSLTASNDPLIIVDGIPFGGSMNDIASDDIESIEILKDASATVIYGSRGANGVIIITTKRGKEGKLRISYNGYQGVTTVARRYELYDAEGFIQLKEDAGGTATTTYNNDEIQSILTGRETDWQDLMYKTGVTSNHEINLSGGTESTQYSVTGGFYDETGVLPEIGFKRFSIRTAIDQKINERVKIGITNMNSLSITDGQSASGMYQILTMSPLARPYDESGIMIEQPMYPNEDFYNPLTILDTERWKEQNRRMASFNTLYGEIKLADGLKYRANLGYDINQDNYNSYQGSNTTFRAGNVNRAYVRNSHGQGYTIENLLYYDKETKNHRFNVTAMQSLQESEYIKTGFDAEGIPADYMQYYNFFLAEQVTAAPRNRDYTQNNYEDSWSLVSYMARVNYAFQNKYNVTVTGRSDGSSRLAPGNKWHSYPAVAAGWNIMNESFMKNIKEAGKLSNLKLRVSYGQTSNTSISPYRTLGSLAQTVYNFGEEGVKGYKVQTLPNSSLGWEYTKSTNVGLDYAFLKNRIYGSVDAYIQNTEELLLGKSLPPSSGVTGDFLENIGATENKGLEFVINGVILAPKNADALKWDVNANLFLNRGKIVALQDTSITEDIGNGWFVGHPMSAIYDYEMAGIWQLDEADKAALYNATPGDIKFVDQNNDTVIDTDDRIILGSSEPIVQGGFSTSFEYKRFDLNIVAYFRIGGMIASTMHMPNDYFLRLDGRRNHIIVDYWTEDNPSNRWPKPDYAIDANRSDVLGYFDGSFLKIRSINLGYNFKPELVQKAFGESSSLRAYASVSDPFIFFAPYLKEGGLDPEPTGTAEFAQDGIGLPGRTQTVGLGLPPTRKILLGINLKF